MEEDEDDFYAPSETVELSNGNKESASGQNGEGAGAESDNDRMDESLEEGEEEDEDDDSSGSEINIITERKDGIAPEASPQQRVTVQASGPARNLPIDLTTRPASVSSQKSPLPPPQIQQNQSGATRDISSTAPAVQNIRSHAGDRDSKAIQRVGTDFPEIRSSTIDVSADPIYEPVGKPISQVNIDADLAEHTKPWRLPGSDQTDYFNYGFDEFTWTTYCLRQKNMATTIADQKAETTKFEAMFTGMGGQPPQQQQTQLNHHHQQQQQQQQQLQHPQQQQLQQQMAPQQPSGMGAGGMMEPVDMNGEMMQAMMAQMMAQGITDPSQMDFATFIQQMQAYQGGGAGGGAGGGMGVGNPALAMQGAGQPQQQQQQYPHLQHQQGQGHGQGQGGFVPGVGMGDFGRQRGGRRW